MANKPGKPVEKKDSVLKPVVDTNRTAAIPPTVFPRKDSFTFKIVIREFATKQAAQQFYNRFTTYGHKLLMYPKDSSITIVSMPFMRSLADTTKLRDSLRIYYGGRPYVAAN